MKKVYDTINQYCVEHELLTNGDGIVIGLSGGMDSVCLLQVLAALRNLDSRVCPASPGARSQIGRSLICLK